MMMIKTMQKMTFLSKKKMMMSKNRTPKNHPRKRTIKKPHPKRHKPSPMPSHLRNHLHLKRNNKPVNHHHQKQNKSLRQKQPNKNSPHHPINKTPKTRKRRISYQGNLFVDIVLDRNFRHLMKKMEQEPFTQVCIPKIQSQRWQRDTVWSTD